MDLTVYRQAAKERPDGTIVYKGEDARPYVDSYLMLVADGLGGASSIRHQKIDNKLFNKEEITETLFNGVLANYNDEIIKTYVEESFFELFAVKDCYSDNINNIKKSGYFASRIVAAIVIHEMRYGVLNNTSLFGSSPNTGDSGMSRQTLDELELVLANKIKNKLQDAAKNGNLVYESSYSGLSLLGTTLCATVTHETEESVEAVYITAGDSRPYCWDKKNGLRQILEDQEGDDGGMTNYISADEEPFSIRCNYYSFTKPCILFNSTDGCFDSSAFISPLAFEWTLLDAFSKAEEMDDVKNKLTDFFETNGRHDDSSTIAMKTFGYSSFNELKSDVNKRIDAISASYFSTMPDLLDIDYSSERKTIIEEYQKELKTIKEILEREPSLRTFCIKEVESGRSSEYNKKAEELQKQIADIDRTITALKQKMKRKVSEVYVSFFPLIKRENSWPERRAIQKIEELGVRYRDKENDYYKQISEMRNNFDPAVQDINALLEYINSIGVPDGFSGFDSDRFLSYDEAMKTLMEILLFCNDIKNHSQEQLLDLHHIKEELSEKNIKLASKDQITIDNICDSILSNRIKLSEVQLADSNRAAIQEIVDEIRELTKNKEELSKDAKESILEKCWKQYWEENYISIIWSFVQSDSAQISNETKDRIRSIYSSLNAKAKEIEDKGKRQGELLEDYYQKYSELMEVL